jgi:hypothetical protein
VLFQEDTDYIGQLLYLLCTSVSLAYPSSSKWLGGCHEGGR